jgi:site-specific DNA-cytosine methylase
VALKEALRPDSFTLEQVNHRLLKQYLTEQGLQFRLVDMWKHGVPQGRKRIIVMAPSVFPLWEQANCPTMAEAIGIPTGYENRSSNARLVKSCDGVGYTVTSLVNRVRIPGGPWRTLTFPELLKLQTFPGSYDLTHACSNQERRKVIGNAVPPAMSRTLMDQLNEADVYN